MKQIIFIFIVSLLSLQAHSQVVIVKDLVTLEPLAGVVVESKDVQPVTTNAFGKADITAFQGKLIINFHLTGYESSTFSFNQVSAMEFEVLLFQNSIFTEEVVVSASRFEEKKEDIAQQIQVLNKNDLRFMNQQTTADVLQHSGNVLVQKSQQGGGSPIIRGMEANKVLMVVDGVRLNNAIFRGGHLQNIITLDNSIMDRVEIAYGPGSVVYGSDALGGVMHFYTRNPEYSITNKVLTKGNTYIRTATANNELSGHLDFNLGGKKIASLTSLTFSNFDDLRAGDLRAPYYDSFGRRYFYLERIDGKDSVILNSNPNLQVGTGYKQYDFLQKFAYRPDSTKQHIINFQFSNSTNVPRYDRLSEGTPEAPVHAVWYYGPQRRMLASYNLLLDKSTKVYDNAKIIFAFQNINESRHNRAFNSSSQSNRREEVQVLSLNADFQKQLKNQELRYGMEVSHNNVTSTATKTNANSGQISFQNTRYPDGGSTMQSIAFYITNSWEINEKLILNAGARYSNIGLQANIDSTNFKVSAINAGDTLDYYFLNNTSIKQTNSNVTGSFGLVYKPGHHWDIAALVSTGFRAPNVDDAGKLFEQTSGAILIPNANLKPETSTNFSLRIDKTINKTVNIQTTGFYNLLNNLIAVDNAELGQNQGLPYDTILADIVTNVNKDKAFIYGFSGQLSAKVNEYFSINSAINYTYGRIKTNNDETPLDHIPPVFGRTGLSLQFNKFRGEFFVMYNGWKRIHEYRLNAEDNEEYATAEGMPAWYTLNIRTQYQLNNYIQIQLACENLLNHHYRIFASGTSGAGRNLMVTLRARF